MKQLNELNNIEFEGYVWLSDQEEPKILNNQTFDFSKYEEGSNPFIIEALLYKENDKSVHITHTGKYNIQSFDLNNLPQDSELVDVNYLPHRLEGVKKVCFRQLWIPENDENCENMPVLKMKALIFVGFDDCKTKK
jgi:CRISPR type III-associated protein (TIGR04423 family)